MERIVRLLRRRKEKLETELHGVATALQVLDGHGIRRGPKKGRKLSAAHKAAIRAGWAKRSKARNGKQ